MICKKCGHELEANAKFCGECGSPTTNNNLYTRQSTVSKASHNDDSFDTLIINLETAIPVYKTLTEMGKKLEYLKKDKSYYYQAIVDSCRKVFILDVVLYFVISFFNAINKNIEGISLVLFGIIAIVSVIVISKNWKKAKTTREEEIKTVENQIKDYFLAHDCPALYYLPEKYRYHIAISYIHECLTTGRASNLKEAINLYEEQCHRWRMEASQQQINAKLDEHSRMLNRVEMEQGILTLINLMK